MKGGLVAAALAALASGVTAAHHRHAHEALFKKGLNETNETCTPVCTTIWKTITGEPTLIQPSTPIQTVTKATQKPSSSQAPPSPTTQPPPPPATTEIVVVPTPVAHTCPTPGTYTFPATTITVSKTTTVCAPASTQVPPGTHTVGGVTTVVVTATTVTCPVATVTTSNGVTTSTIVQTTYVCPSAGTYTIAPITTTVTEHQVVVYPTPSVCQPGTYTAPEQVVTVTKTGYVTYCPFTSKGLPTTTAAPAPVITTSQAPPPPPPAKTSEAPKAKPTSEAPKQSSPPAVSKGLTSNNDHFGITYTPYKPTNGNCKSASDVDADIQTIKNGGFTTVRVYSTDCNTLENVGNACKKYGLSMIVGVFVKASGCDVNTPEIKEQIEKLTAWNNWDLVKLVVVGNEAIMNNFCTPQQLRTLVTTVKSKCSGKYQGQFTISETLNIWQRKDVSSAICDVVDVTGANIHPYFNAAIAPSNAGQFVKGQLDILKNICSGHEVINLECGYPEGGNANGLAIPGPSQQAEAIKSIRELVGFQTVFFSFESDLWKGPSACHCEDKFGLAAAFNMKVKLY